MHFLSRLLFFACFNNILPGTYKHNVTFRDFFHSTSGARYTHLASARKLRLFPSICPKINAKQTLPLGSFRWKNSVKPNPTFPPHYPNQVSRSYLAPRSFAMKSYSVSGKVNPFPQKYVLMRNNPHAWSHSCGTNKLITHAPGPTYEQQLYYSCDLSLLQFNKKSNTSMSEADLY